MEFFIIAGKVSAIVSSVIGCAPASLSSAAGTAMMSAVHTVLSPSSPSLAFRIIRLCLPSGGNVGDFLWAIFQFTGSFFGCDELAVESIYEYSHWLWSFSFLEVLFGSFSNNLLFFV